MEHSYIIVLFKTNCFINLNWVSLDTQTLNNFNNDSLFI